MPAARRRRVRGRGLGFLAAGYKTADGMYQEIKQLRGLTAQPFGVNLFMPQPEYADTAAVEVYRNQLAGEASWYETQLGDPDSGRDDGYDAKLAILIDDPVPVVSFTFGCPTRDVFDAFARVGTITVATVTTPEEAQTAQWSGADAVCVQGVEAAWSSGHAPRQPRDGRLRARPALAHRAGARDRADPRGRGKRPDARRADRRGARGGRGRGAARHGVPGLPRVGRERPAQAGHDQPAVHQDRTDPRLLGPPGPRPGQPLHARARPVRPRRLPPGPPPHQRTAQGRRQGR